MEAYEFLRWKYCVPPNKMLHEELQLPHYTWNDIVELLNQYGEQLETNVSQENVSSTNALLEEKREIARIRGGIEMLKSLQTVYGNVLNFTEFIRQNSELLRTKITELESKQFS